MTKENLKLVALMLSFLVFALFINNVVLARRITRQVVENLKRDYVPGPYEPGFDPDKVPPRIPSEKK
jgi:hypothetical protein